MRVSINGWVGDATKKPPENAMKLRESQLSHQSKTNSDNAKKKEIFPLPSIASKFTVDIT